MEKVNVIHQIRVLLAMHAEKELHELVRANCKMAGADVPSFRRDLTLPVWWTLQHDVQLLRLCLEVGYGQWKKIVGDERIANAPADFEMPPKINGEFVEIYLPNLIIYRLVLTALIYCSVRCGLDHYSDC